MDLRLMSYNIHRAIGVDRLFRPERIARIINRCEADIVLLQEVDVGVPRSNRINLGETLAQLTGFTHCSIGLNVKLSEGMYGNATLSRFPIAGTKNIDLTIGNHKARGCLHTTVSLPPLKGKPMDLAIFNLHLGLSFRERPRQLGMVVRAPEFKKLADTEPCIIAGDFNDLRKRLAPMLTEILGFDCATNRRNGYQNARLTYPSFSPTSGLDKIFCRGMKVVRGRTCRMRLAKVASDHLPVVAELRV